MPSNTPMTAQALLALADELEACGAVLAMAYKTHFACANGPGTLEPLSVAEYKRAAKAYRAARALSPVTLEEALMIREHKAMENLRPGAECDSSEDVERRNAEWINARMERQQHARRLAGEGGA